MVHVAFGRTWLINKLAACRTATGYELVDLLFSTKPLPRGTRKRSVHEGGIFVLSNVPENEVYTREAFLSFQMYHITKCTQGRHVCPFKCTIYQSVHKGGIFVLPNVPHQSYKTSSPSLAVWT